jgi:hypothetical protein
MVPSLDAFAVPSRNARPRGAVALIGAKGRSRAVSDSKEPVDFICSRSRLGGGQNAPLSPASLRSIFLSGGLSLVLRPSGSAQRPLSLPTSWHFRFSVKTICATRP